MERCLQKLGDRVCWAVWCCAMDADAADLLRTVCLLLYLCPCLKSPCGTGGRGESYAVIGRGFGQ